MGNWLGFYGSRDAPIEASLYGDVQKLGVDVASVASKINAQKLAPITRGSDGKDGPNERVCRYCNKVCISSTWRSASSTQEQARASATQSNRCSSTR